MTLYVKPAQDGTSVGDCPFAHFVRMVLAEKGLEYDLVPSTQEAKPRWLVDDYGGKMPALRHRKECYVDSEVIAQYLDFFFREPELSSADAKETAAAAEALDGFFPAMAKFVKDDESDDLPATFWLTNPNNTWTHNVAAGSVRSGYWFEVMASVRGPSKKKFPDMEPG